jgi:hypothetical protein
MDPVQRVEALTGYIVGLSDDVLGDHGKRDLVYWIQFLNTAPDSTYLLRWYPVIVSVLGYYIAEVQAGVDSARNQLSKAQAKVRKKMAQVYARRVTDAQAKAEAYLDDDVNNIFDRLIRLERLHGFLNHVRSGIDPDIIQAFSHNQRLEMRQDT